MKPPTLYVFLRVCARLKKEHLPGLESKLLTSCWCCHFHLSAPLQETRLGDVDNSRTTRGCQNPQCHGSHKLGVWGVKPRIEESGGYAGKHDVQDRPGFGTGSDSHRNPASILTCRVCQGGCRYVHCIYEQTRKLKCSELALVVFIPCLLGDVCLNLLLVSTPDQDLHVSVPARNSKQNHLINLETNLQTASPQTAHLCSRAGKVLFSLCFRTPRRPPVAAGLRERSRQRSIDQPVHRTGRTMQN